jgi:hypothetical protein
MHHVLTAHTGATGSGLAQHAIFAAAASFFTVILRTAFPKITPHSPSIIGSE